MNAIDLVKEFEGCRLVAYMDVSGIWTIGYGHTRNVQPGDTCTQEQAETWLNEDLSEAHHELLQESPGPFAPGAEDALISFVYNVGIGNYRSSTLRKYVDGENWAGVKAEIIKWDHSYGQVISGLRRRRQAEADMITVVA
jgi:lysozyme